MKHLKSVLLPLFTVTACVAAPAQASEAIVKKARCFACHSVETKRIGPAYKDVAAKYIGDNDAPAKLFDKVRRGGAGIWGDIPMSAHPIDAISDDELKAAINWVLSRK